MKLFHFAVVYVLFVQFVDSEGSIFRPRKADAADEFDFIVVGAGTAGCVLANRLTEIEDWKVLLIEAGDDETAIMDVPVLAGGIQKSDADWQYETEPSDTACLGFNERRCLWPRGKVMGGSSSINYMIYTRGNHRDFDNWKNLGNEGWGYEDVLPYFKKLETFTINEFPTTDAYHGKDGPLTIMYPPYRSTVSNAFVEASKEQGIPFVDYNGLTQSGVSHIQSNLNRGSRMSSNTAYVKPIKNRKNFHLYKQTLVTKILIHNENKTAYGVEILKPNSSTPQKILAKKEVIISAGAINSPQLLMLSGVGPKEHLDKVDIETIQDSPGVGKNLMDHISAGGLVFLLNDSVSVLPGRDLNMAALAQYNFNGTGPFTIPGGCEDISFVDTLHPTAFDAFPDLEFLFQGTSILAKSDSYKVFGLRDDLFDKIYKPHLYSDAWMAFPMLLRPESKGEILLQDKNPTTKPLIYPNYLTHQQDVEVITRGIKLLLEINKSQYLQKYNSTLISTPIPACEKYGFGSDEYWECHTRHITFNIYHYSGTCKMGPNTDKTAVVDPRLRVYGVKKLRVVDASIMPEITSGHTNSPTFMIGEKAADLIKEDNGH